MVKTCFFVIIAILIKSVCQYFFGAEVTTFDRIILGLDYPFYNGCVFGGWIMVFIKDNWNIMWDSFTKSITMKFDSGDESSGDEAVKKSWKDKDKLTDSNNSISNPAVRLEQTFEEKVNKYLEKAASVDTDYVKFVSVDQLSIHERVLSSITAGELSKDTNAVTDTILKIGQQMDDSKVIDLSIIDVHDKFAADEFVIGYLQRHGNLYSNSTKMRAIWLECRLVNIEREDRRKVAEHLVKVWDIRDKYVASIDRVKSLNSSTTQAKVFYGIFNEQRRLTNKELNQAEVIVIKSLKSGPFCLVDHQDCKDLLKSLKDYNKAKEKFNSQDNYLKKKIGEMINK